jgi:hypothetical protein
MNRLTIRRFDIVRTANMVAATYVAIGLVIGLIILPFALLALLAGSRAGNGGAAGAGLIAGVFFYAVAIVFYAVVGWVFGAILAAVYNFVAGRIGGLRFDVSIESPGGGFPGYPAAYATPYPAQSQGPPWAGPYAPGHGTGPVPPAEPPRYGAPPAPPS